MVETALDLFEDELRDIYDAEKKLARATQTMAKKVSDSSLSKSFQEHSRVTENQASRLEKVFATLGKKPRRKPCAGINGLIEEFTTFVKEESPSKEVLNVFATGAGQKVENYEITAYEGLIGLANLLNLDDVVPLLEESLREEQEALKELKDAEETLSKKLELGF